jgi:hypothetical protein
MADHIETVRHKQHGIQVKGGSLKGQFFRIVDQNLEPVYETATHSSFMRIDVRTLGLKPGITNTWSLQAPESEREEISFRLADSLQALSIQARVRAVMTTAQDDRVGVHLLRAMVLEKEHYIGDAFSEYSAASEADFSESSRDRFVSFLVETIGLSRKEVKVFIPPADSSIDDTTPASVR